VLQLVDQRQNSFADATFARLQHFLEECGVMFEKPFEVRLYRIHVMQTKRFAHERNVGAPGEFHAPGCFLHPENFGEGPFEGLDAGSATADQSAINVKED
jgi:hypothetical protein